MGEKTKDPLHIRDVQPLQNITDRRVDRGAFPVDFKRFVEPRSVRFNECPHATVGVRPCHNCQNGKKKNVRQSVKLTLRAAGVGNLGKPRKKRFKRFHGNLLVVRVASHGNPLFPFFLKS